MMLVRAAADAFSCGAPAIAMPAIPSVVHNELDPKAGPHRFRDTKSPYARARQDSNT
jgi:hypothetical protein